MLDASGPSVTVGPSILGLVTSGIYDDPLAIYREYIQNAVDELSRQNDAEGKIEIIIDPASERGFPFADNGPGLNYQECLQDLVPFVPKQEIPWTGTEGFRGIGRLSGLAFAESVTFLTRASRPRPGHSGGLVGKRTHGNRTNSVTDDRPRHPKSSER